FVPGVSEKDCQRFAGIYVIVDDHDLCHAAILSNTDNVSGGVRNAAKLFNTHSGCVEPSRQRRKVPNAELPEFTDVDAPVVVKIERCVVIGRRQISLREEAEIADVHAAVAVHVAVEAEQALGVAEGEVVAGRAIAVAVERLATVADLA